MPASAAAPPLSTLVTTITPSRCSCSKPKLIAATLRTSGRISEFPAIVDPFEHCKTFDQFDSGFSDNAWHVMAGEGTAPRREGQVKILAQR